MTLARAKGWELRLVAVETVLSLERFEYGWHDCAIVALRALSAVTGTNVAPRFIGRYHDPLSARRVARGGLEAFAARIAAEWGLEEIQPQTAQRGDPVLVRDGKTTALGFIASDGHPVLACDTGLRRALGCDLVRAWRVPCRT